MNPADDNVCPRCGTPAGEGVWCSDCGLNLKQQDELPTRKAYEAQERERRWLAEQESAEHERRKAEQAERRQRDKEQWEQRESERERVAAAATARRQEKKESKQREKAERREARQAPEAKRKRRWRFGLAALILLLAAGGGMAALLLTRDDDSGQADRQPASGAKSPAAQSPPPPAPSCTKRQAERELRQLGKLDRESFQGVGRLICEDLTGDGVKDMAFTRSSTGSAGIVGWGAFVADDGEWKLEFIREDDVKVGIKAEGGQILRSVPVSLPDDPNCCPSGGAVITRYRYVAGAFFLKVAERHVEDEDPPGFYEE